jgi:hypothetical protein
MGTRDNLMTLPNPWFLKTHSPAELSRNKF